MQGTLPNFFAGAMLCVLAFVFSGAFYRNKNAMWQRLVIASLISFLGLTLWEYLQYFMGYPIDYYDILMTAFGNLLTVIFVLALRIK